MSATEQGLSTRIELHSRAVLVKVDVVMSVTGERADEVYARADGASLLHGGLTWVFDVAVGLRQKRELRFLASEVIAPELTAGLSLTDVINIILPPARASYHSGDLLRMFQIRRPTLADLRDELNGTMAGARNCIFPRAAVETFLKNRWLRNQEKKS